MSFRNGHVPANHGNSTMAASCVATPLHPKTRLPATADERGPTTNLNAKGSPEKEWPDWAWSLKIKGYLSKENPHRLKTEDKPTENSDFQEKIHLISQLSQHLEDDIPNISEREFYDRIHTLKNENAKLLRQLDTAWKNNSQMVDEGYDEEILGPKHDRLSTKLNSPPIRTTPPDADKELTNSEKALLKSILRNQIRERDGPEKYTAFARYSTQGGGRWRNFDPEEFVKSRSIINEESSPDVAFKSLDETRIQDWRRFDPADFVDERSRLEEWRNFSVSRPRHRPSSAPSSRGANVVDIKKQNKRDRRRTWNPKITVPEPFGITLRDEASREEREEAKQKIKQEVERRKQEEEQECLKQFRAQPPPLHIYAPLLREIEEKKETERRARLIQQIALEAEKSRPFEFTRREEEEEERRSRELTEERIELTEEGWKKQSNDPNIIHAKPLPKNIYNPSKDMKEIFRENQEWRKIQKSMRAQRLLKESRSPLTNSRSRPTQPAPSSQPPMTRKSLARDPPDFAKLYATFRASTARKATPTKTSTTPRPFSLKTSEIVENKPRVEAEMRHELECGKERRWPYLSSLAPVETLGQLPAGFVASYGGAKGHTHEKKSDETKGRWKGKVDDGLAERIKLTALANDPKLIKKSERDQRRKDLLRDSRESVVNYRRHLGEIDEKLRDRPLLSERVALDEAQKKAEEKWRKKIKESGVTADFVIRKSFEASDADMEAFRSRGGKEDTASPVDGAAAETISVVDDRDESGALQVPPLDESVNGASSIRDVDFRKDDDEYSDTENTVSKTEINDDDDDEGNEEEGKLAEEEVEEYSSDEESDS